jgi:hypothetical protein
MSVILPTQEAEIRGPWFKTTSGKRYQNPDSKKARCDDAHFLSQLLRRRLEDCSLRLTQINLV